MSRSGYVDNWDDQWGLIRYRGAVKSSIRGKRGQAFLKEMLEALDNLPEKKLIPDDLEDDQGCVCAIGAVGKKRGIDMENLDPYETEEISNVFNVADSLSREIMFLNDEGSSSNETPEARFRRMRKWVESQIIFEKIE